MLQRWMMALFALTAIAVGSAQAQSARTTRIVVAFPPGGPVDLVARVLAEQLGKELGETVIVDNKPGANGGIAAQFVAKAQPDGTTLWLTSVGAAAINPSLYDNLAYDMQRDFAPVSVVVNNVEVLVVNPKDPASTTAEFVAASKAKKEPTPMASSGIGSIPHLAIEQLADATKANLLHVPYKGAAPAVNDLLGGQVNVLFSDVAAILPHVKSGRARALGLGSEKRFAGLPDVPTIAEAGVPGFVGGGFLGLVAPAGTPAEAVNALNAAALKALAAPEVADRLNSLASPPVGGTPESFGKLLASEVDKWARVIRAGNVKPD
jgi:tripartite-type tricarboxylate transporter receptor subunit TctC